MEQIKNLPAKFLASTIKFVGMMLLGVLWLVLPSLLLFTVGLAFDVANPYTSAANAFVFWVMVHIFVLAVYRIIISDVNRVVKECHDDYVKNQRRRE